MKCPYCGNEMVQGYVQSRDGVYFSEKLRPVAAIPPLSGEWIRLSSEDDGGPFKGSAAAAFCCRDCRKIVIDYAEK